MNPEREGTPSVDVETTDAPGAWKTSACILCESNCGIEIRLGGETGRSFERIRGDKSHPGSKGYTCEKALRLDHYQNGRHRLGSPMKRMPDGTYAEVDWDTAIRDVAAGFARVRDTHGGGSIFFYGGGGQGNHLGGRYSAATQAAIGVQFRSNALAQEKTGEAWVNGRMVGALVRSDVDHAEVAVFLGKNPWQSHGFPHARTTLKEIVRDPARAMVVIDPRRSETAEMAEFHLALRPGTDAWCLAALAGVMVQEDLVDRAWVAAHATGLAEVEAVLGTVDIEAYAAICGLDPDLIRRTARRIAQAESVAVFEDLGLQMGLHSTLCTYLGKFLWGLTGNFGKKGAQYIATAMAGPSLAPRTTASRADRAKVSPVVGAPIIAGLVPCNLICDEILTEHPDRYRAMLIDSANPVHSLAESPKWRDALDALEFSVVIDVAMTETARRASYVLPASSQFEKWECTFFNFEFPHNVFQLRQPILTPMPGTLPEPEMHARIVEALGVFDGIDLGPLHTAALDRPNFAAAFAAFLSEHPQLADVAPVLLYRTLGPTLPGDAAAAALLWASAQGCVQLFAPSVRAAGFSGEGTALGDALFDAIVTSPNGVTFSVDDYEASWSRVRGGQINLAVPSLLEQVVALAHIDPPGTDPAYPLVLSAGERRSFTANDIFRDPTWRKRDAEGALRISQADADALGFVTGDAGVLTTRGGTATVVIEVSSMMRAGHMSLPNGFGLDVQPNGDITGVSTNELTTTDHRDPFAGTPYHKHVPARLDRALMPAAAAAPAMNGTN
jgi:anaerobic selenocysteine-containing dehydrogenase